LRVEGGKGESRSTGVTGPHHLRDDSVEKLALTPALSPRGEGVLQPKQSDGPGLSLWPSQRLDIDTAHLENDRRGT
jgi:hypothetical protein